jgi:hypothetical protein
VTPQCNDWDKLSNNLNSRWRELFDSFSSVKGAPEPPLAELPVSVSMLLAAGGERTADSPQI